MSAPDTTQCSVCGAPAKKTVVHISQKTRKEIDRAPMCDVHIQAEIMMGDLSMVDFELKPLL